MLRSKVASPYAIVIIRNAYTRLIFHTKIDTFSWNKQKSKTSQKASKQNSCQNLSEHSKWSKLADYQHNATKNRKLNIRYQWELKIGDILL